MLPKRGMSASRIVCASILANCCLHMSGQCQRRKIKVSILKVTKLVALNSPPHSVMATSPVGPVWLKGANVKGMESICEEDGDRRKN